MNTIKPKEKTCVQMFHNEESLLSEFVTIKLTFEIYFLTGLNGTDEKAQKICSIDCFLSSVKFFSLLCNIYESRSSSPHSLGLEFETNCRCPGSIYYVIGDEITVGIQSPWG